VIDGVLTPIDDSTKGESEVTGIEESVFGQSTFYPNPATDRLHIRFELAASSEVQVDVYNTVGQKVSGQSLGTLPAGTNEQVMDITSMDNGMYIFFVRSENSSIANRVRVVR
jgi:hypothetical protein